MANKEPKFYNVSGILYPDSGNIVDCLNILESYGLTGYCSPLHAPDEDNKKPHYHIFIHLPSTRGKTLDTWRDIFLKSKLANGYVKIINRPVSMAKYLIHLDNPEKEQFPNYIVQKYVQGIKAPKNVLLEFGDVSSFKDYIDNTTDSKSIDKVSIFTDIILWCSDNCCYSYSNLMIYAINHKPEWIPFIASNHAPILAFQKSAQYTDKLNADFCKRNMFSDKQERKILSIYKGSDDSLSSSDIDCLQALSEDNII